VLLDAVIQALLHFKVIVRGRYPPSQMIMMFGICRSRHVGFVERIRVDSSSVPSRSQAPGVFVVQLADEVRIICGKSIRCDTCVNVSEGSRI
jgi:hypothetical protein